VTADTGGISARRAVVVPRACAAQSKRKALQKAGIEFFPGEGVRSLPKVR